MQETVTGDPRKAPKLRVLIVDDDARVRRALRSLIECSPDLTVVGEAGSTCRSPTTTAAAATGPRLGAHRADRSGPGARRIDHGAEPGGEGTTLLIDLPIDLEGD